MIPRFSTLFWMCVIAVASSGLYMVKYRVLSIQKEIAQIEDQLQDERENLRVSSAEWAYLNRPERLQALANKYLQLAPMQGQQMADIETLPYPGQALASNTSRATSRKAAVGGPLIPAAAVVIPQQE